MPKQTYMGQEILFRTVLFGKNYFWMKDGDGTIYLERAVPRPGVSVDGTTGETTLFTEDLVPWFAADVWESLQKHAPVGL